jgi:DNA-binding NarL/FixJ family response regulator
MHSKLAKDRELMIAVSIIEDDPSVRKIIAGWISDTPDFHCAGVHATAAHALAHLPAEKPAVALVDINLPDKSGIECVWHLKPLLPKTQFLMLTVYEDAEHIFKALEAGATGYLLKRTPRKEVLAAVRQVNEGGSPMTSYIARKVVSFFQRFPQPNREAVELLSPREREVIELLARGFSYKEIADKLGIGMPTVNTHIHRTYEKLHVQSRGQAVARYSRLTSPSMPSSPPAAK